ncbi:hypothetical protein KIW84_062733 [Lathyrus oleraceus]|uniref:Uncharacterized protein n=1 Tax=Pisum sativum TaxID=3888 RepID=A0A9D5A699_PEA|nr:hypothetical protein KIW84_062733 [Pisum sativum]
MRRGANTFPSHNQLSNPRFGCETLSFPFLFPGCDTIERGATAGLSKMIELEYNKSRAGIGYSSGVSNTQGLFKSGGFIHTGQDMEVAAILEEDEEDSGNFIIPGRICNNWVAVDIPTVIHKSK